METLWHDFVIKHPDDTPEVSMAEESQFKHTDRSLMYRANYYAADEETKHRTNSDNQTTIGVFDIKHPLEQERLERRNMFEGHKVEYDSRKAHVLLNRYRISGNSAGVCAFIGIVV